MTEEAKILLDQMPLPGEYSFGIAALAAIMELETLGYVRPNREPGAGNVCWRYLSRHETFFELHKKHEGGLFGWVTAKKKEGREVSVLYHFTVKNGVVYEITDDGLCPTGDNLQALDEGCFRIGTYEDGKDYPVTESDLPPQEFINEMRNG